MQDRQQLRVAYGKVVARAWSDSGYKERFLRDPRGALSDAGVDVPSEIELSVVADSTDKIHLVLPSPPAEGEVGDGELADASAGLSCCTCCCGN